MLDHKKRNLLHHAINLSSASADATFETEALIIDLGVDINHRDDRGRVPLHYAFVKIKDWKTRSQIDPIETVSSLCGKLGLEIDVQDKWHKTPLHYASQRGASICAMYMIKRGANLESKDIYGNTPLGVSILNKHYNFGIIMIQKNADVLQMVHPETPEKIKKMWKKQESKSRDVDVDMSDDDGENDRKKKHRDIFNGNSQNVFYGDESDDSNQTENTDTDSDDQAEVNAFNKHTAFA